MASRALSVLPWRHLVARWRLLHVVLWAAVGLLSIAQGAAAQVPAESSASGESWFAPDRQTLQVLRRAEQLLAERRWAELAEHLDYLLGLEQDAFFQPDKAVPLYRSIKSHATALLARLPSEGWQACELRYGAAARRALDEALDCGDPAQLARIARRYFHTQAGAEAAYLMADYELDRGFPHSAAVWYERMSHSPLAQRYEPMLSLKWAVAGQGALLPESVQAARQRLQRLAPHATVHWGPQRLPLHIADADAWLARVAPASRSAAAGHGPWPLAGGDVTRNAEQPLGTWSRYPRWQAAQTSLPQRARAIQRLVRQAADAGQPLLLGVQPLVVGELVLSRTAWQVQALDRTTGRLRWEAPFVDPQLQESLEDAAAPPADVQRMLWDDRHTGLASDGQRVYVLEALDPIPVLDPGLATAVRGTAGFPVVRNQLLAYDLRTGKLLWQRASGGASSGDGAQSLQFLGTPLPLAGTLYVQQATEQECQLVALDPRSGDTRWSHPLLPVDAQVWRTPSRALSACSPAYGQGVLVCPTGAGAAVAFDPAWRSLLWCYRYGEASTGGRPMLLSQPSSDAVQAPRWRHAACLVGEGVAVLAPADSEELHCLDLLSGALRWKQARGTAVYVAGLRQQRVLVVGRDGVRAHDMQTGDVVWEQKFASGELLHGHAACGAEELAVPVSSGNVYVYAVTDGALRRTESVPAAWGAGNLLAADGMLLWQGLDGLTCLDLHSELRRRIEALAGRQPPDRNALLDRGRLYLQDGRLDEALQDLRAAYEAAPDETARRLLAEALLLRLESLPRLDDDAAARLLAALHDLAASPSERHRLAWLSARAAEAAGDVPRAFAAYLELLRSDDDGAWHVADGVQCSRTADVLARLVALRQSAAEPAAAPIDDLLRAAHAASQDGAYRHWLLAALHGRWSQSLSADDTPLPRAWTVADELWLQQLVSTGPSPLAHAAAQHWAARQREAQRDYALLGALRTWTDRRTDPAATAEWPAALADALTQAAGDSPWQRLWREEAFPQGQARVTPGAGSGQNTALYVVPTEPPPQGALDLGLRPILDLQWHALHVVDSLGQRRFRIPLSQRLQPQVAINVQLCRAWFVGHLLLFFNGRELWGIDLLGHGEQPRVLWRYEIIAPANWRNLVQTVRTAWGEVRTQGLDTQGQPIRPPVLLDPRRIALLRQGRLSVLDTLTGEVLWSRDGLAPSAGLLGDGRHLLVLQPQPQAALVLDTLSGGVLRQGTAPPAEQVVAHDGLRLLVWDTLEGAVRLRLWDAATQRDVWQHQFAAGSHACRGIPGEVWIVQPDGACRVISLADGQQRLAAQLEKPASIDTLQLLPFARREVLLVNEPPPAGASTSLPLGWSAYGGRMHGRAYAFDRAQGRLVWSRRIEQQSPAPAVLGELPVLLFAARWLQRDPQGGAVRGYTIQTLCLDVRSGTTLYEGPLGDYTNGVELLGDPQTGSVHLRAMQASLRIDFEPPPAPLQAP